MSILTDQINTDFESIAGLDEFTTDATWYDIDDMPNNISGWFNSPYSRVDVNAPVEGGAYTFRVLSSSVPEVKQGQSVIINETEYIIIGVQPDGAGTTLLVLSEDE